MPAVAAQQLVPQSGAACTAPLVLSVTPYVYNGALDSFDVTLADANYVALGGSAGDVAIPMQLMSRWSEQNGIRTHVDTQSIPVVGAFTVSLTMLSAEQGRGVCAATVTFTLQGPTAAPVTPRVSVQHIPPTRAPATSSATITSPAPASIATRGSSTAATSASVIANPFFSLSTSITHLCATNQGAYELWFTLLALYLVFIVAVVMSDVPAVKDSAPASTAIVLVPLLGLFALWYTIPTCRISVWIGVAACLIALGGLAALLQDRSKLPLLPPAMTS
jgi:hypothetical protein